MQKCFHCGASKKTNRIDTWARAKPFWFANWPWQIFLPWTWNWYKLRETCKWDTKFQPGKRAHLFRFSTFSGNFPVGRTDETCSIYRQPEIPEILTKWKAPYISTASYPDASLRAKEDGLCSPLSPPQGSLRLVISRVSRSPLCEKRKNEANKEEADM